MRRLALTGKIQFDFQVRIGPYFADFVFPSRMLVIEIDGTSHENQKDYDTERDNFMQGLGFTVWRIQNREVQTWSLSRLLDYQPESSVLTYQQAIEFSVGCGFRPIEKRDCRGAPEATTITQPDFYPRLIKRISDTKQRPVYQKCSCGTKAIMYDGQLGPHLRSGRGDRCPNGY